MRHPHNTRQRADHRDEERAVAGDADEQREVIAYEDPAMPTSALVTSRRLGPAIWRESQPAPATRSNSSPAAMPMMSRSRKTAPGLSISFSYLVWQS